MSLRASMDRVTRGSNRSETVRNDRSEVVVRTPLVQTNVREISQHSCRKRAKVPASPPQSDGRASASHSAGTNFRPRVSGPIQITPATNTPDTAMHIIIAPASVLPRSCSAPISAGVIDPTAAPT
jgi:hypothetical protein